ncbi:hypothetical protein Tco_0718956, partial [Tanacetum coccineum]
RYVDGHVDIFDMVDIDLFTVIALNMMVLQLDEGLYALACEEDVHCLDTLVRSFKLVEVYINHGFIVVNSYQRPPLQVMATLEDISEPGTSHEYRSDKMLLLTWHNSSTPGKDSVCESIIPRCMPHGSGIDSSGLSHDESFRVDNLDLNEAEVGRTEVPVSKEAGRIEEHVVEQDIVKEVIDGSYEEDVEHGNDQEAIEVPSDEQVDYDVEGIDSAYET